MLTHTEIHSLWVLQIWLMCSLTAWALWMKWLLSWLEAERLCNNILSLIEVVSAMESEPESLVSSHNTIWCTWINRNNYVTFYLFFLLIFIFVSLPNISMIESQPRSRRGRLWTIHDYTWLYMTIHDYTWLYMTIHAPSWFGHVTWETVNR